MSTLKKVLLAIGIVLFCGFWFAAGYHWRKSQEVEQAHQAVKSAQAQVKQDEADQRAQALHLSDQLAAEQLKSLGLERQLQALQQNNQALQREVAHVHFDAVPIPSIAGTCPDPFSGRVFQRLYDAAAQAQPPR